MRIDIYCEANEMGTPIEIANALIKLKTEHLRAIPYENKMELILIARNELAEIAEHIQVFLKYDGVET